jgi:hypothetical protein
MADRNPDPRKKEDAPVVNDADFVDLSKLSEDYVDLSALDGDAELQGPAMELPPVPVEDDDIDTTMRAESELTKFFGPEAAKESIQNRRSRAIDQYAGDSIQEMFTPSEPLPDSTTRDTAVAHELKENYRTYGGNPAHLEPEVVQTEAERIARMAGQSTLAVAAGLAETRTWWGRTKRQFAETSAAVFAHPDFQVGLHTLDFLMWANKKTKLAFVPREERAEIEQRVLPKVTLDDGSSYTIATGQAIENLWDRVWGANTHLNGKVVKNIGRLVRSDTLQDIGERNMARGTKGWEEAGERVSEAASLMGDMLTWTEVVEAVDPTQIVTAARMINTNLGIPGSANVDASEEEWQKVWEDVKAADSVEPLLGFLATKGVGGGCR